MSTEKIVAETRTEFGKGAARRIRRDGKIPAVVYGHGSDAQHIILPGHDTTMALRHHGKSAVLELEIEGKTQLAMTKQVQVDHLHRVIEHIDFVAVKKGEKVVAEVAVSVVGDSAPDTLVMTDVNTIALEAEALHVPEHIEVSVEGAHAGTQITAGDLTLPAGVVAVAPETVVVTIAAAPTAAQVEAELESAEAEAGIVHEAPEAEAADGSESE